MEALTKLASFYLGEGRVYRISSSLTCPVFKYPQARIKVISTLSLSSGILYGERYMGLSEKRGVPYFGVLIIRILLF